MCQHKQCGRAGKLLQFGAILVRNQLCRTQKTGRTIGKTQQYNAAATQFLTTAFGLQMRSVYTKILHTGLGQPGPPPVKGFFKWLIWVILNHIARLGAQAFVLWSAE
jgi:hypothetical protein